MSPRPDVSAQRMPQILNAAQAVFARRGVNGATVEDIAREAGFSKALVFKYFASKDALLLAFVRHFFTEMHVQLEALAAREEAFSVVIGQWTEALAAAITEPGGLAVAQEMLAAASRSPDMGSVVGEAYARYRQTIAALGRRAMERGELRAGNPDELAITIIAVIEGFNVLRLVATDMDLAASYRMGIGAVLAGWLIQPARG